MGPGLEMVEWGAEGRSGWDKVFFVKKNIIPEQVSVYSIVQTLILRI